MKRFFLNLDIIFDEMGDYTVQADTDLPDNDSVKKILRDGLDMLEGEPTSEGNVETYRAASEGDKEAGLSWPED